MSNPGKLCYLITLHLADLLSIARLINVYINHTCTYAHGGEGGRGIDPEVGGSGSGGNEQLRKENPVGLYLFGFLGKGNKTGGW